MKKKAILLSAVLIFSFVNFASAVDLSQLFGQVKSELLRKGMSAADVGGIQPATTQLFGLGLSKENLVNIVTGLLGVGANGQVLNGPLEALTSLIQSGEKPGVASNLMSLAIRQVKSQNLTGNAAVSKIVNFINQKKDEFISLKQKAQDKLQGQKDNLSKSLGSLLGK
jgi:hypothetical protein